MDNYEVLARKKRPQTFKDILGQPAIVQTVRNAIVNKSLANAYLFCGPRGVGKTSMARLVSKAINCPNQQQGEPCNTCTICKEITQGNSLDVIEIDGASNRGIDEIRKINETAPYAPASCTYKVYIIDEVHMLTKEAFNALLKTLEEPPAHVKFFFATTAPEKLPLTVISRTQRFNLAPFSLETISSHLTAIAQEEGLEHDQAGIWTVSKLAFGSMRDALSLFDQVRSFSSTITADSVDQALGILSKDYLFELDEAIAKRDQAFAFSLAKRIIERGKDPRLFLEDLLAHFRNYLVVHTLDKKADSFLKETNEYQKIYLEKASMYTPEQLHFYLDYLMVALERLALCASKHVLLETVLLKLFPRASTGTKKQESKQQSSENPKQENEKSDQTTFSAHRSVESIVRFAATELEGTLKKNTPGS